MTRRRLSDYEAEALNAVRAGAHTSSEVAQIVHRNQARVGETLNQLYSKRYVERRPDNPEGSNYRWWWIAA